MSLFESLLEAIKRGESEQVSKLLADSDSRDVEYALSRKGEDQWSLLMKAASGGNVDIVNMFLAAKAPVNEYVAGITPLMVACMLAPSHAAAEVTSTLLEAKADPNAIDRYRETCLMKAAARGLADVLHLLLKAGADVNARGNDDHTALYHAAKAGHVAAVKCLLQAGTDELGTKDAVDVAVTKDLRDIIEILAPDLIEPEEDRPIVLPERYTFAKKVLAELPVGDGRVGFPAAIPLLLSGVGQSHYASALLAAGFGVAQLVSANDQQLRDAGVRFAPQRRAIMDGMVRMAVHSWGRASLPDVDTIMSAVHAACNAVRQIHLMWATTVLGQDRGDLDQERCLISKVLEVTSGVVRDADEIRRRAAIIAKLAERKMWTDPVTPADLLRPAGSTGTS